MTLRLAALLGILQIPAFSQINYDTIGATYLETFTKSGDGWNNPGTGNLWEDNVTIPGWYGIYSTGITPTSYVQSSGGQYTGSGVSRLYLFRPAADNTDGALGSYPLNSNTVGAGLGGVYFGVQIVNNTGEALGSFTLGYTLEIWRLGSSSVINSLDVSYRTGAGDLLSGTWVDIPALTTSSPAGAATTNGTPLDGNTNFDVASAVTVTLATPLEVGESLWIRWYDINDSGIDNGLAIDGVSFSAASAIPEPSSAATLIGLVAVSFARLRRRRAMRAD